MEGNTTNEPGFRGNIKQNAKGFHYFDLTVRAEGPEELKTKLEQGVKVMSEKCDALNVGRTA